MLRPIVQAEERRAGAHLIGAPKAVTARDQVGLRALNDLLKAAFDQPGIAAAEPGDQPASKPPTADRAAPEPEPEQREQVEPEAPGEDAAPQPAAVAQALWFKQSPVRLHPGEKRTVTLLADPIRVLPGTEVEIEADPGLTAQLRAGAIPEPGVRGYSAVQVQVRARVTVEPGARLSVLAAAGEHTAELEILIVRHRASGWVREIARKDEDQLIEAEFDPETGVVTVYEGRREFRELERAARTRRLHQEAGVPSMSPTACSRSRPPPTPSTPGPPNRSCLAAFPKSGHPIPPSTPPRCTTKHQTLRHRAHHKLMQAFLEPEIFEGAVTLARPPVASTTRQLRLVDNNRQ